jgi:hypothetical protein
MAKQKLDKGMGEEEANNTSSNQPQMVGFTPEQFQQMMMMLGAKQVAPTDPVDSSAKLRAKVQLDNEADFVRRTKQNEQLAKDLSKESNLVPFSIPEIYKMYTGNKFTTSINGQTVVVPVDGKTYNIPKQFIPVIQQNLKNIDRKVASRNEVINKGQYGGVAQIDGSELHS